MSIIDAQRQSGIWIIHRHTFMDTLGSNMAVSEFPWRTFPALDLAMRPKAHLCNAFREAHVRRRAGARENFTSGVCSHFRALRCVQYTLTILYSVIGSVRFLLERTRVPVATSARTYVRLEPVPQHQHSLAT